MLQIFRGMPSQLHGRFFFPLLSNVWKGICVFMFTKLQFSYLDVAADQREGGVKRSVVGVDILGALANRL
jgi:hypothetical protein